MRKVFKLLEMLISVFYETLFCLPFLERKIAKLSYFRTELASHQGCTYVAYWEFCTIEIRIEIHETGTVPV